MIELKGIKKQYKLKSSPLKYRDYYALDNISTIFRDNIISGITGSSGSGKTTLANIISGYDRDYSGEILYDGSREKDQNFIRYVFQDPYISMNPVKTVEWHISTAAEINHVKIEKATEKLEMAGMDYSAFRSRYVNSLSGGELQKLALAISLIPDPNFIVLDEAFSMMDSINLFAILTSMKELKKTVSLIYIDHDINRVSFVSDYIYIMNCGKIIEENYTEKIMEDPEDEYTGELIKYSPDYRKRI
ncbi:MAG: ATP-binding cassette domain-containing protein [Candidatus Thermoplasmatota archaeon]|jgi:peptide/nickel transport system ATP-binding protein|uniref:ABC transporter ATP-binding protein n=1 Tax=Ferroplasma sp. Type II TaxID=261388 RepID=UPI0003896406|nr:ATP-binding cassette domain-containing protein [Ferroplasma sp. Type II]EQB72430.1 MAG: oligopeptide ABC transporter Dpp1, ATP binding protein [Ferroplasma sp. Type II]MCL4312414.1 ATP-binding cassette domain-containing protein [Candidatus Thermoplasmatota archaeon]